MDYHAFLSSYGKRKEPQALRDYADKLRDMSDVIFLAGGLPNPEMFPFKAMKITLKDDSEVTVNDRDLVESQQYGRTVGNLEVVKFVRELTKRLHNPPTMDDPDHPGALSTIMTTGSQDAIAKTVKCLIEDGDYVLTSYATYAAMINSIKPNGGNIIPLEADKDGIVIESLKKALSRWSKPENNGPAGGNLKALYCIPNGDNPTGIRYSVERKREIYKLAQEYNFLIIEDDAYYMLEERPFTDSFLSMDVDGRVIRFDTFSKTVAPGLRIASLNGPEPIVQKIVNDSMDSTQGCSPMTQMLLLQLFRRWGIDGYLRHCEMLMDFYRERRQLCESLVRKHLTGLVEWNSPTGGMFLWLRLLGLEDSKDIIVERVLMKRKVFMVYGMAFTPEDVGCPYIRVSFSIATEEQMERGFSVLAEELRLYHEEIKNNKLSGK